MSKTHPTSISQRLTFKEDFRPSCPTCGSFDFRPKLTEETLSSVLALGQPFAAKCFRCKKWVADKSLRWDLCLVEVDRKTGKETGGFRSVKGL